MRGSPTSGSRTFYNGGMMEFSETYEPIFAPAGMTFVRAGRLSGITTALTVRLLTTPAYARIVTTIPFGAIKDMASSLGLTTARQDSKLTIKPTESTVKQLTRPLAACDLLIIDDAQNIPLCHLTYALGHAGHARTIVAWHPDDGHQDTIMWLDHHEHITSTWRDNADHLNPVGVTQAQTPRKTLAALFPTITGGDIS